MKRTICSLLSVIVTLFTGFVFAVWAATVVSPPTGPQPTTNAPPPAYVGPTENLTKVANALSLQTYSLTTQVFFSRGLALAKPVCITVFYDSYSGSAYSNVLYQAYNVTSGNRFIFNDPEGLSTPRQATLRVQLFEPGSGGCGGRVVGTGFDLPQMRVNLDPLYDVATSALDFTLGDNCDPVGESQIGLHWYSPDGKGHSYNFSASAGKTITFPQFVWSHAGVSASANLHTPVVGFWKRGAGVADPNFPPSKVNLVPGKTRTIRAHDVFKQCRALIEYTITYSLSTPWKIKTPPTSTVGNK